MNAKAVAQAAKLDEIAKLLKRASYAHREALQLARQLQEEVLEVETISPAREAQDDASQNEAQAA